MNKNNVQNFLRDIKLTVIQLMLFAAGLVVLILALFQKDPDPIIGLIRSFFGAMLITMSSWLFRLK